MHQCRGAARMSDTHRWAGPRRTCGRAVLHVPSEAPVTAVVATKSDRTNFLFFGFKGRRETKATDLNLISLDRLNLSLNGTKTVSVRVVDDKQQPIAGRWCSRGTFKSPTRGVDAMSHCAAFDRVTNTQGNVSCDVVPADNRGCGDLGGGAGLCAG